MQLMKKPIYERTYRNIGSRFTYEIVEKKMKRKKRIMLKQIISDKKYFFSFQKNFIEQLNFILIF